MDILLTHEQADFDAVASLLGAYLLNDSAYPVLPRRINRNVRAFLALYGEELPFIEARDLPNQQVKSVTLVDTQSLVSVRGMGPWTQVQVIDHHPRREGLPADWQVTTAETGATATLLVETVRQANGPLSSAHATLLLLGIYEDTGSLTYTRTTPQDLRAAAYLLEQGANLRILTNFINQPLSPDQQDLYDRLRSSAETLQLHGHSIVIACGDAQGMDEELSSIAHKLRDLLDPDALFLLVTTRSGIQVIARSTSDQIDVAAILARFGGGGHERAAAGLVRGREPGSEGLAKLCQELKEALHTDVHPAVTVAEIMSRDPQLLAPDTPLPEIAQRMQRYGYEGFPVVQDGKVVGLITRRAVDRAISHQMLTETAASLMEAGEYWVQPEDSVEHLQRLVVATGWGQVPVIDPHSQAIIGIVTRTDLLKTLAPETRQGVRLPAHLNLAGRLETVLPPARLALLRVIASEAHRAGVALYIVGGFVRDLLLEQPSLDFDLVVEGDAIALAHALQERYGGRVTSHARFGTAKWRPEVSDALVAAASPPPEAPFTASDLKPIDLVSARTEFYTYPTALPTVERGNIKLDLHRRDFTINTLALRLDGRHYGELHDYWGGLGDLRNGLVRVLHSLSFVDDPTRMLRAARFEQRLDFRIEDRTMELLERARPLVERLSGDRLRHELDHILDTPVAYRILKRLQELRLLEVIHPALGDTGQPAQDTSAVLVDDWLAERLDNLSSFTVGPEWLPAAEGERRFLKRWLAYILWLLRLPSKPASQVIRRLKLPVYLSRAIQAAGPLWTERSTLEALPPSQLTLRLGNEPLVAVLALRLAVDGPLAEALQTYASRWRKLEPGVDGETLKALGLPPGPRYREILTALRAAWLDGRVASSEAEAQYLEQLLKEPHP